MNRDPELVTVSQVASWAWCPESWRLKELGHEPQNLARLEQGEALHAERAAVEESSRSMLGLGIILVLAAAVLGLFLLLGAFR